MRAALIISWAGSAILSHSMRKLCLVAAPCSLAIFLSVYLFPESWLIPAGLFCILSICFSFFLHGKARTKYILAAIGLSIGFMWTSCYGYLFRTPALSLIEEGETDAYYPKGHIPKPAESQHLRENNRRPAPGPLFFHTCKRPTADRSKNPMARRPSKRRQFPRVPASPIPPA